MPGPLARLLPAGLRPLVRHIASFAGPSGITLVVLMIVGAVLEGVGLACFLPLIGLLVGSGESGLIGHAVNNALSGIAGGQHRLIVVAAGFALVMLTRAVVLARRDRKLAELQIGFVEHERLRLLRTLAQSSWPQVVGLRHARISAALGSDIARIGLATHLLLQSSVAAVMLAGQWAIALLIAPRLAGTVLVLLVGGALAASRPALRRAFSFGAGQSAGLLGLMDTTAQLLAGLKPAFAQNMQGAFTTAFATSSRLLADEQLAYQARQSRMRLGIATLAALAGVAALIGGRQLGLSAAVLLTTLAIFSRMTGPLSVLLQNVLQIAAQLPAHDSLETLLADLATPPAGAAPLAREPMGGAIVFEDVSYRHRDGGGVSSLSLRLAPREIVGITGASGAGKTTLVDLLAGLMVPDGGTIRVGDVLLDPSTAAGWRDRVAYVAQEPFLFHDTVRRNLELGGDVLSDEALWEALSRAEAEPLVRGMAAGLDTMVGERGMRLSGGERQRIALARALLRRPALLILDEATNAIDVATEGAVLRRIAALAPRPTVVLIAHRGETMAICDRVFTLEQGRIAAIAQGPAAGRGD